MKRILPLILAIAGCSSPYDVRLSDDKSASNGPLFFFGWADPSLIPGTRLVDARPGSRVVLWNHDLGLEAIVDVGETCPVLVCDGDGARAPTARELACLAVVFPSWPVVASTRAGDYGSERRLERKFWSHILRHLDGLEASAAAEFALGDSPAGWLNAGGRERALCRIANRAPLAAVPRIVDRAKEMSPADFTLVVNEVLRRRDLRPELLTGIAKAGAPIGAVRHPAADESVCMAAIEVVAKEPLSAERRRGLEAILTSPGVTEAVRKKALSVPLSYPEDREAVRRTANGER